MSFQAIINQGFYRKKKIGFLIKKNEKKLIFFLYLESQQASLMQCNRLYTV